AMSVNKYQECLLVLPEDDANRQLANGFSNNIGINENVIQVLPEAGGWKKVLNKFEQTYSLCSMFNRL
ncbi:MAG: hypothetical protein AAFP03_12215, partial [Cyanobacteria bacterium J06598_3]